MFDFNSNDATKLLEQLKIQEGCVKNKEGLHLCYSCPADKLTIGYGHNLEANPIKGIDKHSQITDKEAEALLLEDVKKVYAQVQTFPFERDLDPVRTAVIINMAFNMGLGSLRTFKKTLAFIDQGDYAEGAANMLASKWAKQVGKRAQVLAMQMRTGQWTS